MERLQLRPFLVLEDRLEVRRLFVAVCGDSTLEVFQVVDVDLVEISLNRRLDPMILSMSNEVLNDLNDVRMNIVGGRRVNDHL